MRWLLANKKNWPYKYKNQPSANERQFQAPTLIVINHVNCKLNGTPLLPANDASAETLNKLYGSSKDKLKQNLSRLYKLSSLSVKERAELLKGIDIAREYYKELECTAASKILDELELKLTPL